MHKPKEATLYLEDGFYLKGLLHGKGEVEGEVVFNTSMTGYQEILTDPSYKGQIVCMSYPLIGNYGVSKKDIEARRLWTEGFIVKELSRTYSGTKTEASLVSYLLENNVPLLEKVDTRALVRHLRIRGALRGIISTRNELSYLKQRVKKVPAIEEKDLVKEVVYGKTYTFKDKDIDVSSSFPYTVVVVDCGVKLSILKNLYRVAEKVIVVPADATLEEILRHKPDGIVFSNGPGDPARCTHVIDTIRKIIALIEQKKVLCALMGICLGHQMMGIALGGKTRKLKFGHHGGNHPVKDLIRNKIFITAQNHNYIVDIDSPEIEQTYINLYDKTPEGLRHKRLPLVSVQFHPEAGPGPEDVHYIFDDFVKMIEKVKK